MAFPWASLQVWPSPYGGSELLSSQEEPTPVTPYLPIHRSTPERVLRPRPVQQPQGTIEPSSPASLSPVGKPRLQDGASSSPVVWCLGEGAPALRCWGQMVSWTVVSCSRENRWLLTLPPLAAYGADSRNWDDRERRRQRLEV